MPDPHDWQYRQWWPELWQPIIDHFTGRGWFQRRDVCDLTGLDRNAYRLLQQMVTQGVLIQKGQTRGRKYKVRQDVLQEEIDL